MVDEVLYPGIVCVARWRHTEYPALVFLQQLAAPIAIVEGWIRQHIIGLEISVHAPGNVLGAICRAAQRDVADEVNDLAEAQLIEPWAPIVLGQHALERRVIALDGAHRIVYQLADGGLGRVVLKMRPAR